MKTRLHFSGTPHNTAWRWLALGCTFALPLLAQTALAQAPAAVFLPLDPQPTLQALDPQSTVPPAVYRSTRADLPRGVEETRLDWRLSNDAVGQFKRGHIDLLRLEQQNAAPAAAQPKAGP
ncbi:MAG: hypothetical protein Q7U05_06335 [Polaromonas sp.]|nr:hypothetical protein [Polaromonas sp.]